MRKIYVTKCNELKKPAQELLSLIKNGARNIFFTGELGSGKTTLIREIMRNAGFDKSQVKSPTYTYCREYKIGNLNFNHVDLYRLTPSESYDEIISDEAINLIEWADKIGPNSIIKPDIRVTFEIIDDQHRTITIDSL